MTTSYMLAAVLAGCVLGALVGAVAAATLEKLREGAHDGPRRSEGRRLDGTTNLQGGAR